jgi:hypothetical protein
MASTSMLGEGSGTDTSTLGAGVVEASSVLEQPTKTAMLRKVAPNKLEARIRTVWQ